ncbi:MAG: DUF983 domain-containing protein [Sphingomonadales bacterium]
MSSLPALAGDALKGACPQCGAKTLFDGIISFAPKCGACGLDYSAFNVGDGPAAFLTLIVGAIVVLGAVMLELIAGPPFWVHILIWPAVTLGLVIAGLRVGKGMLLASEYRNAAREGRLSK